jgi:predicted TIM-barrel fold metal-dependent hydrolase
MSLLPFAIVDPHIHQWDPYHTPHKAAVPVRLLGRFPRVLDAVARASVPRATLDMVGLAANVLNPYQPADYARDCGPHAVEAIVHIEAGWHDHHGFGVVGETRWVSGLPFGNGRPALAGIVATADPASPDFEQVLWAHRAAAPQRFKGIRRMASHHADPGVHAFHPQPHLYTDADFLRGFGKLAEHGLRFDAWAYSTQLPDVTALANRFPEVPLVIDHLATPVGVFGPVGRFTGRTASAREGIFSQWQDELADLAAVPHVQAKLSGLLMPVLGVDFHKRHQLASADTLVDLLAPFVEHAINVFGCDRLIWASNFPMDKVTAALPDIIEAYVRLVAPQGEAALRKVFRENALGFYGIGGSAGT